MLSAISLTTLMVRTRIFRAYPTAGPFDDTDHQLIAEPRGLGYARQAPQTRKRPENGPVLQISAALFDE